MKVREYPDLHTLPSSPHLALPAALVVPQASLFGEPQHFCLLFSLSAKVLCLYCYHLAGNAQLERWHGSRLINQSTNPVHGCSGLSTCLGHSRRPRFVQSSHGGGALISGFPTKLLRIGSRGILQRCPMSARLSSSGCDTVYYGTGAFDIYMLHRLIVMAPQSPFSWAASLSFRAPERSRR